MICMRCTDESDEFAYHSIDGGVHSMDVDDDLNTHSPFEGDVCVWLRSGYDIQFHYFGFLLTKILSSFWLLCHLPFAILLS